MNEPERREIELFHAATALPLEQRKDFLEAAWRDEPALRQKLEALLKVHEDAELYFERFAGPPGTPGTSTGRIALTEKPGDDIGRYKLLEKIGEGGFGAVYVAEQREPVKRRLALKIIKLGMDTREVVARFEAERQALAMMDHPNIAKVFDAGATESGRPYFVMELVHGIQITDYCDQNHLSTAERLKLFLTVCHAVQHAHQKGIIHRDIKPSNILVTLHDGVPVSKVIDFGIAKATQQELTEKTVYTQVQQFIGTPAYMSPEQAEMSGLDIDTRSDIYSLGVLLYELLVGATPFDGRELIKSGLDEMRRIIREKEPMRPSTKLNTLPVSALTETAKSRAAEPMRLASQLRGDLDWVAMKCLEKDRTRRYETASALALDLQRHLADEPVTARPPSTADRFQKLVRRHKLAIGAATAIAVALLLGIVASSWQAFRATRAEREQIRLRQRAEIEAARSEQVAQFMREMLEGVAPKVALGRDTTLLRDILDRTAQRVDAELSGQPDVAAQLYETLGGVYVDVADFASAEAMHRKALALRQRIFGPEHPLVAKSLGDVGGTLTRQDKLVEAEQFHREALAMRRKVAAGPDSLSGSLIALGWVLQKRGELGAAETCEREALEILKRQHGTNHLSLAVPLNLLGNVLMNQQKLAEAEAVLKETLALRRATLPTNHPATAQTLDTLGQTLSRAKKFTEAEATHREALALRREVLGTNHSDIAVSLTMLGSVLSSQSKWAEAEEALREAVVIFRGLGRQTSGFIGALNEFGTLLQKQGRHAEAEPYHREALSLAEKLDSSETAVSRSRRELGNALRAQGKFSDAESLLVTNYATVARSGDTNELRRALDALVRLYGSWGKSEKADEWRSKRAALD